MTKCLHLRRVFFRSFFFFSSRRRHTRCLSDWSSDVCSSDLLRLLRLLFVLVAQGQKSVVFFPPLRLVLKLALLVGIGLGRGLPVGRAQLLQQTRRLARHQNEFHLPLFVSLHRLPAIETRVCSCQPSLHSSRNRRQHGLQVAGNLLPARPISIAQLPPDVLSRLGDERQNRLVTLLPSVLGVITLACSHLVLAVNGVHRGVGIQGDAIQPHRGRRPHSLPHLLLHLQQLLCHAPMQGIQKPPVRALHRQRQHLQNANHPHTLHAPMQNTQ